MANYRRFEYMIPVANACRKFRKFLGYTQTQVAKDLGISYNTVSVFESGGNDSARILLWYIKKGLTIHDIYGEYNGGVDNGQES